MDKAFELAIGEMAELPLSLLDPDPKQPRKDFDQDYLENELAPSIKAMGVIQPIVVRTNPEQPGRFYIVAGENRWRASKIAKLKTILAIRKEVEGLDKLLMQLAENNQRRGLNPIEFADSLYAMHKEHGLKYIDIEALLKKQGVGQYSRAYISNIVRLRDLPDWAQNLIRNNAITASHGKYLIPATSSEKVIGILQEKFEDNWRPTVSELEREIFWTFSREHPNLIDYKTLFDYQVTCVQTGCQKKRKVTFGFNEGTFCLDRDCYAIQQAEAQRAEKSGASQSGESGAGSSGESKPREVQFDADNRVDVNQQQLLFYRNYRFLSTADFDTSGCDGCVHRHVALDSDEDADDPDRTVDSCFLVSCYIAKDDESRRARRLVERHMRSALSAKLLDKPYLAIRFLTWLGASSPYVRSDDRGETVYVQEFGIIYGNEEQQGLLFRLGLTTLSQFINADERSLAEMVGASIDGFPSRGILDLWDALRLTIEDYRIDEHFLGEHTGEELTALIESVGMAPATYAAFTNAQKEGELDRFALEHAAIIGIPPAIRFAYGKMIGTD